MTEQQNRKMTEQQNENKSRHVSYKKYSYFAKTHNILDQKLSIKCFSINIGTL